MSSVTSELLLRNKEIKEKFLELREIAPEYQVPNPENRFGFIYCVENLKNGLKYIGSTYSVWTGIKNPSYYSALMKRASHYVYEYNTAMKKSPSIRMTLRTIIRAFCEDGIENFVMYPVAETTKKTHFVLEDFFIEKYDSVEKGYNGSTAFKDAKMHTTDIRRIYTRAHRVGLSDAIIAVNMNRKELVLADSMKLFGDFLGVSKDQVKNNVRGARSCHGWFIFYLNPDKRFDIVNNYVIPDNYGVQKNRSSRNLSEKYKKFYLELFDAVNSYLNNPTLSGLFEDFKLLPPIEY